MGKILVDGSDRSTDFAPDITVTNAFESLRDEILESNRVVVDVEVDGKPIVWDDGGPEWSSPLASIETLVLRSDDPQRMSKALLDLMQKQLPLLHTQLIQAAQFLRQGNTEGGVKIILEVMPWWQHLQTGLINVCKLHGIDYEHPDYKELGDQVTPAIEQLTEQLAEFRDAADRQDFGLLADLLEFEFAPMTQSWQTLCTTLEKTLTH